MRAKVCYTLSPKLYHKCKPIATNRSAFPRRPRASSPYRRCTKSDRSHDSSRVQGDCARPYGTPWTLLLRPLATATPCTACPVLPKHTLRATMKVPLLRPRLHQIRRATLAVPHESTKRSRGSFPFEAVIARNTIPNIEVRLRSPIFQNASRWLWPQRLLRCAHDHALSEVAPPSAPLSSQWKESEAHSD
jgi:hypothetical protein